MQILRQVMLELLVPAWMVDVSDHPLRFRSPNFRSQYDSEFGALCEYSEFHTTLVSSARFRKT